MTNFQQVYYTSCEEGVRGGKGFQILAHSESMPQPLLRAIEQLAAYSPPRSLPTRPSPEEVERFPVSLLYQRLKDGTPVVARNRYVGRDYSGRFGNFFMHVLVPEGSGKAPLPMAPISLWEAPFWRHESGGGASRSLPSHPLEEGSHPFEAQGFARFLQEGHRLEWVSRFLGAVETALGNGRRIILVDTDVNVSEWVKLACSVLPESLCLSLTFDTYARSPYERDVLLVGTSPDTDFRFSPHELEYQFYVFDFAGTRSTRTLPETPFSRQVSEACRLGRFEELARFPEFVRSSRLDLASDHLSDAFTYYAIKSGLPIARKDAADCVSPAQVLRWCASNLAVLDVDALQRVCRTLLETCNDAKETAEAACDLLRACQSPEAARACRLALVPWLFELVSQHDDVEWLSSLLQSAPSLEHEYPEFMRNKMRALVVESTVPRRCRGLLELLDHSGALRNPSSRSGELGRGKFDLLLSDEGGQGFLREKVSAEAWRDFFDGAVEHCEETLRTSGSLSADWIRFLGDGGARKGIRRFAVGVHASKLQAEIGRLGVAEGVADPVRELEQCLRSESGRDPQTLDQLYQGLFSGKKPTLEQAVAVASLLRGRQLTPAVFESLGTPLLEDPELRDEKPRRRHLASDLHTVTCTAEVPEVTAVIAVISLTAHIGDKPGLLRPAQIVELEKSLRWLPDAFMAPTVTLVADGLLNACHRQDGEAHRACFAECVAAFGEGNFQPLFAYVFWKKIKHSREPHQVQSLVAHLFSFWAPTHRTHPTRASAFVMNDLLLRTCRTWNRKSRQSVEQILLRMPLTQQVDGHCGPLTLQWIHWLAQHEPGFWQKILGQGGGGNNS